MKFEVNSDTSQPVDFALIAGLPSELPSRGKGMELDIFLERDAGHLLTLKFQSARIPSMLSGFGFMEFHHFFGTFGITTLRIRMRPFPSLSTYTDETIARIILSHRTNIA